jgi:hypothetical protein
LVWYGYDEGDSLRLHFWEIMNTVGSQLLNIASRQLDKMSAVDAWKAKEQDYLKNLIECAEINRKKFDGDFYILTTVKNEPIFNKYLPMPVLREYYIALRDCPTPNYDQNLYFYNSKLEQIEFVWTVPDRDTSKYLFDNKEIIDESEKQLLRFVMDYADGTLFRLMKKFNGEEIDSNKLEK